MELTITLQTPVEETPRLQQVMGMFDIERADTPLSWSVCLPLAEKPWHIGLIVGPSGSGKSTVARALWPKAGWKHRWPRQRSILDAFPRSLSTKSVVGILSSVGLSSPPAWLRPFHVLSTGQQFRVTLARLLAEAVAGRVRQPIVFDEYTSVVDRTVAQVGSAAVARTIRQHHLQFVAVTCHEDVEPWLNPDWVYRPEVNEFTWRLLRRRPDIRLTLFCCRAEAWRLFAPHHYLSDGLHRSARCYLATWQARPVAFSAWLRHFGGGPPTMREHRTVTLPDYQGVGIGNAVSETLAALWKAFGYRAVSTTTHPAMIAHRCRSPLWQLTRPPALAKTGRRQDCLRHATTRLTASFAYIGPALPRIFAQSLRA